jgi:hypothetical protein
MTPKFLCKTFFSHHSSGKLSPVHRATTLIDNPIRRKKGCRQDKVHLESKNPKQKEITKKVLSFFKARESLFLKYLIENHE